MSDGDYLNPRELLELYDPLVQRHQPQSDETGERDGPPPLFAVVDVHGQYLGGPIFGDDWDSPAEPLRHLHPGMLPGKHKLAQACLVQECESLELDGTFKTDVVVCWSATADSAWIAMSPFTRTWTTDAEGTKVTAIAYTERGDPDRPPVWGEVPEKDLADEPVLAALRSLVVTDPDSPIDPADRAWMLTVPGLN